jgi:hypothetical protein
MTRRKRNSYTSLQQRYPVQHLSKGSILLFRRMSIGLNCKDPIGTLRSAARRCSDLHPIPICLCDKTQMRHGIQMCKRSGRLVGARGRAHPHDDDVCCGPSLLTNRFDKIALAIAPLCSTVAWDRLHESRVHYSEKNRWYNITFKDIRRCKGRPLRVADKVLPQPMCPRPTNHLNLRFSTLRQNLPRRTQHKPPRTIRYLL